MSNEDTVVRLGDLEIDLAKGGPLKWKDIKRLQNLGVNDEQLNKGDPEHIEKFVRYILERASGGDITDEQIDELEILDIQKIVNSFGVQMQEVNAHQRPTLTSSTSSGEPTGGVPLKSAS